MADRTAFPIADKDIREAYDSLGQGNCIDSVAAKCRGLLVELQQRRATVNACGQPDPEHTGVSGTIMSIGSKDGSKWDIVVRARCHRGVASEFGSRVYDVGALRLSLAPNSMDRVEDS